MRWSYRTTTALQLDADYGCGIVCRIKHELVVHAEEMVGIECSNALCTVAVSILRHPSAGHRLAVYALEFHAGQIIGRECSFITAFRVISSLD